MYESKQGMNIEYRTENRGELEASLNQHNLQVQISVSTDWLQASKDQ